MSLFITKLYIVYTWSRYIYATYLYTAEIARDKYLKTTILTSNALSFYGIMNYKTKFLKLKSVGQGY